MGLRSGLWLGQGKRLTSLAIFQFFATFEVCLGSLSSIKIQSSLFSLNCSNAVGRSPRSYSSMSLGPVKFFLKKRRKTTPCMNFRWMLNGSVSNARCWVDPSPIWVSVQLEGSLICEYDIIPIALLHFSWPISTSFRDAHL